MYHLFDAPRLQIDSVSFPVVVGPLRAMRRNTFSFPLAPGSRWLFWFTFLEETYEMGRCVFRIDACCCSIAVHSSCTGYLSLLGAVTIYILL